MRDYAVYLLGVVAAVLCVFLFISYKDNNRLEEQLKASTVQNVQLTKQMREVKADAFRAGITACTNEDIEFLNEMSDELAKYPEFSKLFHDWAQTWAYDEDTLNQMVETYMEGDTH